MNAHYSGAESGGRAGRERVRVVLTGACDGLAELRDALENHPELDLPGWCEDVRYAAGILGQAQPAVVLHATRESALPASDLATIREHTQAPIILLASGSSYGILDHALEADVADVLLLPQYVDNVVFAVRKARQSRRAGRPIVVQETVTPVQHGQVITVFGPKGGSGRSVVATSLATALTKYQGRRTVLIDLDLQFGDAAIMLGADPEKTVFDLVSSPGEVDAEKLAAYTMGVASGVDLLAAPLRPEDAEFVTEAKVARVLEVARESYDVVVVDTAPFFHGPVLATLDQTDELLLLCGLDVPTLKNVRLSLQTLELLSFPPERIRLVVNQAAPRRSVKRSEVEAALGVKVSFEIPYDSDVPAAVNRGVPPVLNGGLRVIREIAATLAPGGRADGANRLLPVGQQNGAEQGRKSRWPALGRA
jgi:pilus assembly protein CpaE